MIARPIPEAVPRMPFEINEPSPEAMRRALVGLAESVRRRHPGCVVTSLPEDASTLLDGEASPAVDGDALDHAPDGEREALV